MRTFGREVCIGIVLTFFVFGIPLGARLFLMVKAPMRPLEAASLRARTNFSVDLERAYAERCLKR